MAPDAANGINMRRLILSGVAWKGMSQTVTQATRLVVAVILARLLAPHDYGLAGLALVFTGFVLIISDLALGSRLVQRKNLTEEDCSTAFWTSVGAALTFTALGIGLSGPVSELFGQPALKPMIAVLSLGFFFSGISLTQSALLVKSMSFRALEVREMAATLGGGAIGIVVASTGYGAWGIIAQQLAVAVISAALVWRYSSWRPRLMYSRASLRDFAGFSGNIFGTGLLWQLRATSDNFLIGRFIGPSALGAYSLAYNVILTPFNRIAVPLSQVLFPAMSEIQDDLQRLRTYWIRALRFIAAIALPAMLGLIVVAPDFTDVVLGHSWRRAAPVMQLLAIVGVCQTLQFLNGPILQAVDKTHLLLRWSAISYGGALISFLVGLHWGILGVAAAYAGASAIVDILFARATAMAIGLPLGELARPLIGIAQAAAGMAICLFSGRLLLVYGDVGATARFSVLVPAGAVLYLALCAWRAPEVLREVRSLRSEYRIQATPLAEEAPQPRTVTASATPGA